MDRILYKEANGDLTCRARDFDKVFPTLYAYEETGMTPEQIVAMKGLHTARLDLIAENEKLKEELEQVKAERDAVFDYLKNGHLGNGCSFCKHYFTDSDENPCKLCITERGKPKWEWRGAKPWRD